MKEYKAYPYRDEYSGPDLDDLIESIRRDQQAEEICSGKCPNCGGKLIKKSVRGREPHTGRFQSISYIGCSNCHFTCDLENF